MCVCLSGGLNSWRNGYTVRDDPPEYEQAPAMEFRLTYEGPLKGASQGNTRAKHKHEIRKYFHPQLKRLWETHPLLKGKKRDGPGIEPDSYIEYLAKRFPLGPYNFVPLVNDEMKMTCGVDILFLRPDAPGEVIQSGDIDNRLKTLFDTFSRPTDMANLGGYDEPDETEKPFFCLVADDSLISRVSIDTDMLLEPVDGTYDQSMARLIISVTVSPYITTWENNGF